MSRRLLTAFAAAIAVLAAILATVLASGPRTAARGGAAASATGGATVNVLYAGSLVQFMEERFDPGFQKASGYDVQGFAGGSNEVAEQIKGGVRQGDVFISAAPSADRELMGAKNGARVSWYATFAQAPLVLAYNPHTKLGRELREGVPWYRAIVQAGAIVGRTDPRLDPKGKLTVQALQEASMRLHDSALKAAIRRFPVFPETALVGRLQAGQLEAGFFYTVEAASAKLASVPLGPVQMGADYTVTVLEGAGSRKGAEAFVRYLLGPRGAAALRRSGLQPVGPRLSGDASAVPAGLRHAVGAR